MRGAGHQVPLVSIVDPITPIGKIDADDVVPPCQAQRLAQLVAVAAPGTGDQDRNTPASHARVPKNDKYLKRLRVAGRPSRR